MAAFGCCNPFPARPGSRALLGVAAVVAGLAAAAAAWSQPCPSPADTCGPVVAKPDTFPRIRFRAFAGVIGSRGQDSTVSRRVTLVWDRDTTAEKRLLRETARGGFGGYNLYRVFSAPDTCQMELVRRFVYADSLLWHFPKYLRRAQYAGTDSEYVFAPGASPRVTFVDPDSAGNLVKRCRRYDEKGLCASRGDSVFALVPPPPPPDGFAVYYTILYAPDPALVQGGFEDLFVPDPSRCAPSGERWTCCNMNNKALNLMAEPVYTTAPPTSNLEQVCVVPNPYRGSDPWDPAGGHRVQFRNLPPQAEVRVYTASGDLVRVLDHGSTISGAADWDLKNGHGRDVTSGIYLYRIRTPQGFEFRDHLVIVR